IRPGRKVATPVETFCRKVSAANSKPSERRPVRSSVSSTMSAIIEVTMMKPIIDSPETNMWLAARKNTRAVEPLGGVRAYWLIAKLGGEIATSDEARDMLALRR